MQTNDSDFSQNLLLWHSRFGRTDLPWQLNHHAYGIWISEIMLQQTQVQTAIPYYQRFMHRFPDIVSLANADEDDVLHHWSGLGYYARARNLHRSAQIIQADHKGFFPDAFDAVIALPGIGRSTAGAILAFAFQQRHPILDGNVKRVLCRYCGISGYPGLKKVETVLWQLADKYTPNTQIAAYTQAIMDLGATCCTRNQPNCVACPQHSDCFAHKTNQIDEFPSRKPKSGTRKKKSVFMLVLTDKSNPNRSEAIYLIKRPSRGIWGGLYCFPEFNQLSEARQWIKTRTGTDPTFEISKTLIKHRFTHFDLTIQPLYLPLKAALQEIPANAIWHDPKQPHKLGLPKPVQTIIDTL